MVVVAKASAIGSLVLFVRVTNRGGLVVPTVWFGVNVMLVGTTCNVGTRFSLATKASPPPAGVKLVCSAGGVAVAGGLIGKSVDHVWPVMYTFGVV